MTARRRQKLIRSAYFAVAAIAVGAALVAPFVVPGWMEGNAERAVAASEGPFGQHYRGMNARRAAAGVPTMTDGTGSGPHLHPELALFVAGKRVEMPANIGIDPTQEGGQMAVLHTHNSEGTIHVEGMSHATLGQFFRVWGVAFSPTRLGPHRATTRRTVRMWVDGKPSLEFGDLALADGQDIVIAYGDRDVAPPER